VTVSTTPLRRAAAEGCRPVIKVNEVARQRVAIARALANDPRLILADAPTVTNTASRCSAKLYESAHRRSSERGSRRIAAGLVRSGGGLGRWGVAPCLVAGHEVDDEDRRGTHDAGEDDRDRDDPLDDAPASPVQFDIAHLIDPRSAPMHAAGHI
jgi:hypothetical protein